MNNQFPNKAGDHADTDDILRAELKAAGIPTMQEDAGKSPEFLADMLREQSGEVKTSVMGTLHGWKFERGWRYWVASGPGIDVDAAERLQVLHGEYLRVAGHAGSPTPAEWYKGLAVGSYHIDQPEGLKALADVIKHKVDLAKQNRKIQFALKLTDLLERYNAEIRPGPNHRITLRVDGDVIWTGFLERFSGGTMGPDPSYDGLRESFAFHPSKIEEYKEKLDQALKISWASPIFDWHRDFRNALEERGLKIIEHTKAIDYTDAILYPQGYPLQAPTSRPDSDPAFAWAYGSWIVWA